MMQKEEKIVIVLLVMAVLTLTIGYLGFSSQPAAYSKDSKPGERVYVEGTVLSKQMTKTGDHLIMTISNLNINVFIPKNNGAKEVYDSVKIGDRVRINGKVEEYKNTKEIVVESAKDVVRLSATQP
ncbi:RecG-like helicase [Candidatus Methanoperedens nitroreducens]|uniref:RecG-like helicase n=1 Tax=Candidatus Methanoperedens nitratireducens TaxID=1392998 RepID=A0A062V580_9EURY|nr:OB-fold nucleic acid binding domain-containing protein [Candidatus Methanoperedens nitroreducens]KCZ72462.1 RecG-like helicase [Candidatus Methanoperedens nitroreducens]MDJ1423604.1 OB-fold nucleic acid binding domain-containing protein [Candidatus Methanoperedens sp.]